MKRILHLFSGDCKKALLGLMIILIVNNHFVYSQNCSGCTTTINATSNLTLNRTIASGQKYCFSAAAGPVVYTGTINIQGGGTLVICGGSTDTIYFNGSFLEGGSGSRTVIVDGNVVFNDSDLLSNFTRADFTVSGSMKVNNLGGSAAGFTGTSSLTVNTGATITFNSASTNLTTTINVDGVLNANGSLTTGTSSTFSNTGTLNITGDASFSGIYNNHGDWHIGQLLSLAGSANSNLTGGRFYSYDLTFTSPILTADPGGCAAFIVTNFSDINSSGLSASGNIGILDLGNPGSIDDVNLTCAAGDPAPWDGGPYCGVIPVTAVGAGGVGCFATLPVEWISYSARQLNDQQIKIEWVTAKEINNASFTVQRSNDGVHFTSVGKVDGAGNSTSASSYSFIDDFHYNGIVFYRIIQMDIDGTVSFSDILAVSCSEHHAGLRFDVFPNPSDSEHDINLTVEGLEDNSEVVVVLMDNIGHTIYSKVYISERDNMLIAIGKEINLLKGVYFVTASSHQTIVTKKLIVE